METRVSVTVDGVVYEAVVTDGGREFGSVEISADGVWAGNGRLVDGGIVDCAAPLGDDVYGALEAALKQRSSGRGEIDEARELCEAAGEQWAADVWDEAEGEDARAKVRWGASDVGDGALVTAQEAIGHEAFATLPNPGELVDAVLDGARQEWALREHVVAEAEPGEQENAMQTLTTATNLDELLASLNGLPADTDLDGVLASLPTFGGEEPRNTGGVWSWDETRVLVGASAPFRIVTRAEWAEMQD